MENPRFSTKERARNFSKSRGLYVRGELYIDDSHSPTVCIRRGGRGERIQFFQVPDPISYRRAEARNFSQFRSLYRSLSSEFILSLSEQSLYREEGLEFIPSPRAYLKEQKLRIFQCPRNYLYRRAGIFLKSWSLDKGAEAWNLSKSKILNREESAEFF